MYSARINGEILEYCDRVNCDCVLHQKLGENLKSFLNRCQSLNNGDIETILESINENYSNLKYFKDSLESFDIQTLKSILEREPNAIRYMKQDEDLALTAVENGLKDLNLIDDALLNNIDFLMEIVKINDSLFKQVGDRQTYGLCKIAVSNCGLNLRYVSEMFRDFKLCKIAVLENGEALEYCPEPIRNDRSIIIAALNSNGEAIRFLDKSLHSEEYLNIALKNTVNSLIHLDDTVKNYTIALKYCNEDEIRVIRSIKKGY